jgi:hypothetical protein
VPEPELAVLIRSMSPTLREGSYVYVRVTGEAPAGVRPVVTVREDEGMTLILRQEEADVLGLDYSYVAAWITLEVESDLAAVGLTAAFSAALTEAGISANVVAGFTHDHVFVPRDRAADAVRTLHELAARDTSSTAGSTS